MKPVVGGMRHLRHLEHVLDFDFPCEIHDTKMGPFVSEKTFKVFLNSSERSTVSNSAEEIIQKADQYDLILTVNENVLHAVRHAVDFPFGGSWVYPREPGEKDFSVSFLLSHVRETPLHMMRYDVWRMRSAIKTPTKFYLSALKTPRLSDNRFRNFMQKLGKILPDGDKINLFKSMFSICPENWSERGYFTEKIIDCFVTRTVPIYLGCTNIGDYFDAKGIILFKGPEDLLATLNTLSPTHYYERAKSIETNYQSALSYVDFNDRIRSKIKEHYSKKRPTS